MRWREYLYFCSSTASKPKLLAQGEDVEHLRAMERLKYGVSVSICTSVLVKQGNFGCNWVYLGAVERLKDGERGDRVCG